MRKGLCKFRVSFLLWLLVYILMLSNLFITRWRNVWWHSSECVFFLGRERSETNPFIFNKLVICSIGYFCHTSQTSLKYNNNLIQFLFSQKMIILIWLSIQPCRITALRVISCLLSSVYIIIQCVQHVNTLPSSIEINRPQHHLQQQQPEPNYAGLSRPSAPRVLVEFNFLSDHERRPKEKKVRAGNAVMMGEEPWMRNQGLRCIPLREGCKKKKKEMEKWSMTGREGKENEQRNTEWGEMRRGWTEWGIMRSWGRERHRLRRGRWNEPMKIKKRWKGCCLTAVTIKEADWRCVPACVCAHVCICTWRCKVKRVAEPPWNCYFASSRGKWEILVSNNPAWYVRVCVCVCVCVCVPVRVSERGNNGKCLSLMALH